MFNLTMTNFKTLETKRMNVYKWSYIESSIRTFIRDYDEIVLENGKLFIKKEGLTVAGCIVKEFEKQKGDIFNGDIFYADLGEEDGTSIQHGIRPVIVVSCNQNNEHSDIIQVVACTSSGTKAQLPTHVPLVPERHNGLSKNSIVICEQIIPISKMQLQSKIGFLKLDEMEKIAKGLKTQLNLK